MNILINGCSGYIGRNLIEYIKKDTENTYYLITSKEIEGFCCVIHNQYKITKEQLLKQGISDIDVVVIMGNAVPTSSRGKEDCYKYIYSIETTYNLLENLPNVPESVVYISSVMVYQPDKNVLTETSAVNPATMYGAGKVFCEKMVSDWCAGHNVKLRILRIGQVYGKGDDTNLLIPSVMKKALNNENIEIYTNGMERRSFIHIQDVVKAVYKAIFHDKEYVVNIVPQNNYSVSEVVCLIVKLCGSKSEIVVTNQIQNTTNYMYDNTKARQLGLIMEEMDFEEGLLEQIEERRREK